MDQFVKPFATERRGLTAGVLAVVGGALLVRWLLSAVGVSRSVAVSPAETALGFFAGVSTAFLVYLVAVGSLSE